MKKEMKTNHGQSHKRTQQSLSAGHVHPIKWGHVCGRAHNITLKTHWVTFPGKISFAHLVAFLELR